VINILSKSRINLCHFVLIRIKADDLTYAELPNNVAHNQKSCVPAYFLSYIVKLSTMVHFRGTFSQCVPVCSNLMNVPSPDTIHYVYNFDKSTKKMCLKLILQVT